MAGGYSFNGRSAKLRIGASSASTGDDFGAAKSWQISVNRDLIDVMSFDSSGWMERYTGYASWELTAQTLALSTAATQEQDTLRSALSSESRKWFIVTNSTASTAGGTMGAMFYCGYGYVTGWDLSGDESSPQIHNFTVSGDGTLHETTASY